MEPSLNAEVAGDGFMRAFVPYINICRQNLLYTDWKYSPLDPSGVQQDYQGIEGLIEVLHQSKFLL